MIQLARISMLLLAVVPAPGYAQERAGGDWPWFLGPTHDGASAGEEITTRWPAEGPPVLWGKKIGTGYSAPSVRGDRLVLHHRQKNEEIVHCLEAATGEPVWTYKNFSAFSDPFGYNNGPRCTPCLTNDRCYTLGAAGHLACLDMATGKAVWKRDLLEEYQVPRSFFGVGATPLLDGERLFVAVGGQPNSGVVAFDAATGKVLWQAVGKQTWNKVPTPKRGPYQWTGQEMVVSYASPIAATIHGKRHILCFMRQGLVSLDPQDGSENFHYWFRPAAHESVNAAQPVVIGDTILLSAAYRLGSVLLRVGRDGKSVTERWKNPTSLQAHWTTPIVVDGYAYGFTGRHENEGALRCIDLKDGSVKWSTSGYEPDLHGQITVDRVKRVFRSEKTGRIVPRPLLGRGSHIRVGKHFVLLGERGLLASAVINPERYEEISRTEFKEIHYPAWTAPVLSRGRLFLRCEDALLCLDLAAKPDAEPKPGDGEKN